MKSFGIHRSQTRHENYHCLLNPNIVENRKRKLFTCEDCGSSYTHKNSLVNHQRRDCGRSHICTNCGHIYSEFSSLRRHLRKGSCI